MDDITKYCEIKIEQAKRGLKLFKQLCDREKKDKYVVFWDDNLIMDGIKYFKYYKEKFKNNEKILLIFCNKKDFDRAYTLSDDNVEIKMFPRDLIETILTGYALCDLSPKLKVISVNKPYRTCVDNLLGKKGIGTREIVCFDIYELNRVPI